MEKDFSKAISNNEKKKKRNSRFYYNSKSIHFFRNRTKNREFHFRNTKLSYTNKNFQGACHLLQKPCFCPSLVEDGFREIRFRRISGSRDFHSVFFNFHQEGGGRKVVFPTHQPASVHTYAPIGYSVRDPIEKSIP